MHYINLHLLTYCQEAIEEILQIYVSPFLILYFSLLPSPRKVLLLPG